MTFLIYMESSIIGKLSTSNIMLFFLRSAPTPQPLTPLDAKGGPCGGAGCDMFLKIPGEDKTENVGKIGNVEIVGKVTQLGKLGKVGKVGKVRKVQKVGKVGRSPNGSKCLQMARNGSKWVQLAPNDFKLLHLASKRYNYLQMAPNGAR